MALDYLVRIQTMVSFLLPSLLATLIVCVLTPHAAMAERKKVEPKELAEVLADLHVVEGKISPVPPVLRYSGEGVSVSEFQLDVCRVYCGEGLPANARFAAVMAKGKAKGAADSGDVTPIFDDIKSGDSRIWVIERRGDGYVAGNEWPLWQDDPPALISDSEFLLPFLGRPTGEDPTKLDAAPKVAAALHSLSKARDGDEQIGLLKSQVCTGGPFVAVTDCWLLYKADGMPDRAKIAMELFLDPRVPVSARACLDQLIRQSKWPDLGLVPGRDKAFFDMASRAGAKSDFTSLGVSLSAGVGTDLSLSTCVEMTRIALANDRFLSTCDEETATEFVRFAAAVRTDEERDKVFEFFSPRVGAPADSRFELAAATAIVRSEFATCLTPEQVDRLVKLRATSHNEKALARLDLAIAASRR